MHKIKIIIVMILFTLIPIIGILVFLSCYQGLQNSQEYNDIQYSNAAYGDFREDVCNYLEEIDLSEDDLDLDNITYYDLGKSKEMNIPVKAGGRLFLYIENQDVISITYIPEENVDH